MTIDHKFEFLSKIDTVNLALFNIHLRLLKFGDKTKYWRLTQKCSFNNANEICYSLNNFKILHILCFALQIQYSYELIRPFKYFSASKM